jgi:hypothetical protein
MAAGDQGLDPGPARRNSGQGTRWQQAVSVSPEREPHSGSANVLNGLATAHTGIHMPCPHCDNALVTIVEDGPRVWMGFAGMRTLQVTI